MSLEGTASGGGLLRGKVATLHVVHGLSAYEVAVVNGFSGTEEEWLASLKGEKGEPGVAGYTPQKGVDYYTPEDMALVQEFLTIMPMLHRYIFQHQLEECDVLISPNQMHALLTLKLFPRSNMTQLASRLMVSKQQLTKIVDVLAEKGLVRRLGDENNRRLVLLELTETGAHAVDIFKHAQAEKAARFFSDIL